MRVKCAVLGRQVAQDGAKIHRGELDPDDRTITEE
jgi:nitrogen fixation NifU-like protein